MVGLVVTPTTLWVLMSSARLPLVRRSRERSSSQMETPASGKLLEWTQTCKTYDSLSEVKIG